MIRATMSKRSKAGKMNALGGAFAMRIAREKGDPLYVKMKKLKFLYKAAKLTLLKRYGSKGKMAARLAAMGKVQSFAPHVSGQPVHKK